MKIKQVAFGWLLLICSIQAYSEVLPRWVIGAWEVTEVHINTSSGRTARYGWGDPRLMWRTFEFIDLGIVAHEAIEFKDVCNNASASYIDATFYEVIIRSIGGYALQSDKHADPVVDYKLDRLSGKKAINLLRISCGKDLWQADLGISSPNVNSVNGAWIAVINGNYLYLRWRDETILLLRRIQDGSPIETSFDCGKSGNQTEISICASRDLAGLDKSVARAYREFLGRADGGDRKRMIANSQILWVENRNKCGGDASCIAQKMKNRINALMEDDN